MPADDVPSRWRWAVPAGLAASWLLMAILMARALVTPPPAEVLVRQRMVAPPTPVGLGIRAGVGFLELVLLGILTWPGWRAAWGLRSLAAGLGAAFWFVASTPLAITSVERVHRRWLAAVAMGLLLLSLARGIRRMFHRTRGESAAGPTGARGPRTRPGADFPVNSAE